MNKYHKLIILFDQTVFSGGSFLLTLGIARFLDIENFGTYSAYVLIIYLLINVLGAFVIQPFQVSGGQSDHKNEYLTFVFWLQLFLIYFVTLLAFIAFLVFDLALPLSVLIFGAGFIFQDFARKVLLALNRIFETLVLDFITYSALFSALFFFKNSSNTAVDDLMLNLGISYLLPAVISIIILKPFFWNKPLFLIFLKQHLKEGRWLFMTAFTQWWSSNLFVIGSGIYLGAASLGALRLAQSLMGILNILLQTFENYVLPQTAIQLKFSIDNAIYFLSNISIKAALLFIPVLVVSFIFASPIITYAGGLAYTEYAYALQGMAVLYLLVFVSQPIRILIRVLVLNHHFFYGYLLSLSFALLFGHYLLEKFHLIGAIAGLMISQVLVMTYWGFILYKKEIAPWKSYISS